MMDELRLSLELFSGPLDLLLYLVRKNEMEILDIDIAEVTEQFCLYLEAMREMNLDIAAEYLLMASRLTRMKASYVDPHSAYDEGEDEVIDPKETLIKELLRYRAVREAALRLTLMLKNAQKIYPSGLRLSGADDGLSLDEVSVWQLAFSFARLMSETGRQTESIVIELDERTVEEYLRRLLEVVEARVEFIRLLGRRAKQTEIAGYFLAVLEGVRRGALEVYQTEPFGRLYIKRKELVSKQRLSSERETKAG